MTIKREYVIYDELYNYIKESEDNILCGITLNIATVHPDFFENAQDWGGSVQSKNFELNKVLANEIWEICIKYYEELEEKLKDI